ncbi:hypothetical protein R5H32_05710 [Defluviimonas sp. D31]|uniref:hypothetical protein n=1 Tax=Defluviimonas sp. D31 TaxID=3083253 RepID=UPI00296FC833|nr:hypothetical protein [Defluviimonas sp. D31]MDW4548845.1 hypothetical protein [Defluviimonas sp. D31]
MTEAQRFRQAVRTAGAMDGLALSLNLSIGREGALFDNDEPLRRITHYINRELKKDGLSGLPYALKVEICRTSRKLHLHGVIIPGDESLDAIKGALRRAAGEWQGRAKARQIDLKPISDADGWADYLMKAERDTDEAIRGDRLTFNNTAIKRIAKEFSSDRRMSATSSSGCYS